MVGASLACRPARPRAAAHRRARRRVPLRRRRAQPSYDDRAIALAYGSQRIFAGLGLWRRDLRRRRHAHPAHPCIRSRPLRSHAHGRPPSEGVEALGYVVRGARAGRRAGRRPGAAAQRGAALPGAVDDVSRSARAVVADVAGPDGTRQLSARLRGGGRRRASAACGRLGVRAASGWDYGQTAMIANVTPERPHEASPTSASPTAGRWRCCPVDTAAGIAAPWCGRCAATTSKR